MFAHLTSVSPAKTSILVIINDPIKAIVLILVVAVIFNILTFNIVRLLLDPDSFQGCDLEMVRDAPPGGTMNYLIAGTYNQPGVAYGFLMDDLIGGITLVNFRTAGWNARKTAEQIHTDIVFDHFYNKVRIFTISVGDHVARHLEQMLSEYSSIQFEVIAINPCPSPFVLNENAFCLAHLAATLLRMGRVLTGWLSVVPMPFLATPGGKYSLSLLADQFAQIIDCSAPDCTDHTPTIIISREDQFLDNDEVREVFLKSRALEIFKVEHGDTIGSAAAYHDAVMLALKHSKF